MQITSAGRDELVKLSGAKLNTAKAQILQMSGGERAKSRSEKFTKKFGAASAQRAIRELSKLNWITAFQRTLTTQGQTETPQSRAPFAARNAHADGESADRSAGENRRNFDSGKRRNRFHGAYWSRRKSARRRSIHWQNAASCEIFVQRSFSRPAWRLAKLPAIQDLILTDEQAQAFREIEKAI